MRNRVMLVAVMLVFVSTLNAAEKLKGVYSGSGGFTSEAHRVLMVEFGEDGTCRFCNRSGREKTRRYGMRAGSRMASRCGLRSIPSKTSQALTRWSVR